MRGGVEKYSLTTFQVYGSCFSTFLKSVSCWRIIGTHCVYYRLRAIYTRARGEILPCSGVIGQAEMQYWNIHICTETLCDMLYLIVYIYLGGPSSLHQPALLDAWRGRNYVLYISRGSHLIIVATWRQSDWICLGNSHSAVWCMTFSIYLFFAIFMEIFFFLILSVFMALKLTDNSW